MKQGNKTYEVTANAFLLLIAIAFLFILLQVGFRPAYLQYFAQFKGFSWIPSKELVERFFPGVPITRELGEHEALFSNRKIREVLRFKEQHNWQKYVKWD